MAKIHSHYDNLKVARDAPPGVIRAAYRALSQQYHPDISTMPDATRIMSILNTSYAVLSDPAKRKQHDAWIDGQERKTGAPEQTQSHDSAGASQRPEPNRARTAGAAHEAPSAAPTRYMFWPIVGNTVRWVPWQIWLLLALATAVWLWPKRNEELTPLWAAPIPTGTGPSAAVASAPTLEAYSSRPEELGYLDGRSDGYSGGYSTVSIDNTSNDFDVYVKLVASYDPRGGAARIAYVPAHQSFTMQDIAAGMYEIRYINLNNKTAFKSQLFSLTEESQTDGIQYSQITMTLYTVRNGNTHMQAIGADQF